MNQNAALKEICHRNYNLHTNVWGVKFCWAVIVQSDKGLLRFSTLVSPQRIGDPRLLAHEKMHSHPAADQNLPSSCCNCESIWFARELSAFDAHPKQCREECTDTVICSLELLQQAHVDERKFSLQWCQAVQAGRSPCWADDAGACWGAGWALGAAPPHACAHSSGKTCSMQSWPQCPQMPAHSSPRWPAGCCSNAASKRPSMREMHIVRWSWTRCFGAWRIICVPMVTLTGCQALPRSALAAPMTSLGTIYLEQRR